jgi:prepilin-type N-terminal cleavage/methylation domain-containing protein
MLNHMQRLRREDGFTLIELLIVIVVLGILASIVLFAIGSTKDDATTAKNTSNAKICATAKAAAATTGSNYTTYLESGATCPP